MSIQFTWKRPKPADEMPRPKCSVIVPAAGSATRMEGKDKILTDLGDKPVIAHTLLALQQCDLVDEIIVVTRQDLMEPIAEIVRKWDCRKVVRIILGGATRAESVWLGMNKVSEGMKLIAVHDGARPFVSQELLREVITMAAKYRAAAPAVPVKDTIKRVDPRECVEETVPRESLRAVQTPQVFDAILIKAAMQKAVEEQLPITDDCSAAELMGMKVYLTKGSYQNIKITTPIDLVLGEAILSCQQV